jgi:hypothetical protein
MAWFNAAALTGYMLMVRRAVDMAKWARRGKISLPVHPLTQVSPG